MQNDTILVEIRAFNIIDNYLLISKKLKHDFYAFKIPYPLLEQQ